MKLGAVSIDLDSIGHYRAIHGLPSVEGEGAQLIYERALWRVAGFAERLGLRLTLFAVGADVSGPAAERLRAMAARGHEVENHSQTHPYDLSRRSRAEIEAQVRAANHAIEGAVGRRPRGFRAPGYLVSDPLYDVLASEGLWDSSPLPSPAYHAAKTAVRWRMRRRGRESGSSPTDWSQLRVPRQPYVAGRPCARQGEQGPFVMPVAVTPGLRLPVIGTALTVMGERGAVITAKSLADDRLVNLELHALDFLDAGDGLATLVPHQPDLRVPWDDKVATIGAVVTSLRETGRTFVTLDEAAHRLTQSR